MTAFEFLFVPDIDNNGIRAIDQHNSSLRAHCLTTGALMIEYQGGHCNQPHPGQSPVIPQKFNKLSHR